MKIEIPYGEKKIPINIPNKRLNSILKPNEVIIKNEEENLKNALNNPFGCEKFSEFITDDTLIIVNDATRPTPTRRVLEFIRKHIKKYDVNFIIARGSHSEPNKEEYKRIFGDFFETHKDSIYSHDSKNDKMVEYGTTSRGTNVKFNRLLSKAENVVNINSVEPHYFAGFTGGRKSFLPGIASYETIEENHYHSLKNNAQALKLNENPIHEDMMEAVEMIDKDIFSINITLDQNNRIYSVSTGDYKKSFLEETKKAKEVFSVPLNNKSEIVVTSAYPMDVDLYQSLKAFENGKLALREGGIIILVSKCPKGIGPENFYDLLSSLENPDSTVREIEKGYKLGYQKAYGIAEIISCVKDKKPSKIWSVTSTNQDKMNDIFISSKDDLQEAIHESINMTDGKVTFLIGGSMVVPSMKE